MPPSTRTLVFYALPALPLAALTLPLYIVLPTFYAETLGVPLAAVGAALLVVRLLDALSDPVIGWLADRWRPAFGRRRTVFLASLPLTAVSGLMLFWPPTGAGAGHLAFWGCVLSLGYTGTLLPYAAWGAEMAGDYRQRARIAGWREAMTLAGTLVAIAVPFAIGFEAPGLNGLAVLGLCVALGLPVLGLVAVAMVAEPREHSHRRLSLAEGVLRMARNRPFLRLIAAFLLNGLANGIPATLFLYFVSERLGAPEMRGPLLLLYFVAGILGVPLALGLSARLGKHRAWCLAMLGACVVFAMAPMIGPGGVVAFAALCLATGLALGFDLTLPAAIQADVIDVDTAASGEQRSGSYFAAWSLATKMALALAVGLSFPLLAAFGFQPGGANDDTALAALAATYAWLPVGLKLAAVALMWNFPLDEARQVALRGTIEGRAAAGRNG